VFWPLNSSSEFSGISKDSNFPLLGVWVSSSHLSQSGVATTNKKMHLTSHECCCRFWFYFMFLKLSAPSSIVIVACTGFLNMFLNFEIRISMLLKFIQVVWTCFWNFHFETTSLLWFALVFWTCFWNFELKILVLLKPILVFQSYECSWGAFTWFVFRWS